MSWSLCTRGGSNSSVAVEKGWSEEKGTSMREIYRPLGQLVWATRINSSKPHRTLESTRTKLQSLQNRFTNCRLPMQVSHEAHPACKKEQAQNTIHLWPWHLTIYLRLCVAVVIVDHSSSCPRIDLWQTKSVMISGRCVSLKIVRDVLIMWSQTKRVIEHSVMIK